MDQKDTQLPYFEKVQHLKGKSRAKNIFAQVSRTVVKVYLCKKVFGLVALKKKPQKGNPCRHH